MLLLGNRSLDNSDWGDLGDQFDVGLTFDQQIHEGAIGIDFGMYWSGDDSSTSGPGYVATRTDIFELNVGALKMFYPEAPIRPYAGAGVALA